MRMRILLKV